MILAMPMWLYLQVASCIRLIFFQGPRAEPSVSLCLPLQMIYSHASRCNPCLVLISLTLWYLHLYLARLPNLLLLLFLAHPSRSQMEASSPAL